MISDCKEQHSLNFERRVMCPEQEDSMNYVRLVSDKLKTYVSENHFRQIEDDTVKRKLVKNSIKRVAVEVSSFCNRQCRFCPNLSGARSTNQKYLDEHVYSRILHDLNSIDFDKTFMFHLYNEPLADPTILERVRHAKKHIPRATLYIATNGDYLNIDFLESLYAAGVNKIYISMYDAIKNLASRKSVRSKFKKMLLKLGLSANREAFCPNLFYQVVASYQDMAITIASRNLNRVGYDRGGLVNILNRPLRSSPCFSPFVDIDIDWRGNFLPCCNIYSDNTLHHKYVAGNLHDGRNIFDHYSDKKMVRWRKEVFRFHPKINPCRTCSRLEFPELISNENFVKFAEVSQILSGVDSIK